MIKHIDRFINSSHTKATLFFIVLILSLLILKDRVNIFISEYLTMTKSSLEDLGRWPYALLTFIALLYVVYKLVIKRYNPSLLLIRSFILVSFLFLIFRFTSISKGWSFIKFQDTDFRYIDFIGLVLLTFILCFFIAYIWRLGYKNKLDFTKSPFIADDPISELDDDELDYKKRAQKLYDFLLVSNFKKSFTIGIVGPWGNGKSSLISILQRQLNQKPSQETIHLKFLPYLNHSESDIISEFFNQLSKEINKHSGRLANYILDYSDRLLKLYKNKSLREFLKPKSAWGFSQTTSLDSYNRINLVLKEMDKKFIVFIDDLDRLSSSEVLQVLKLVRNTANFRNFIFVIALDKDYVLNVLINNNDISDHAFVDKFFQLEVYLPEIDKAQLKESFISLLNNSILRGEKDFVERVSKSVYQTNNLFDEYITNFRGVKRLINQLIYDYHTSPDELDSNDFLNFTYLKMSFPSAIKYLNNNWQKILPYNAETKLRQLKKKIDDSAVGNTNSLLKHWRLGAGSGLFNPKFDSYEMTSHILEDESITVDSTLSKKQNILLSKTFIALFGEENNNPQHTSIKFGNNLQKLIQQKASKEDITHAEFKVVISIIDSFNKLEEVLEAGKVQQVLDRVAYYFPEDIDEAENIVLSLLHIYNKANDYGTHKIHVLQILIGFLSKLKERYKESVENEELKALWKKVKNNYLNNSYYDRFGKIEFITFLSANRYSIGSVDWIDTESSLKILALTIYKEFLVERDNKLWDRSDYSFYHAYHEIRKLYSKTDINPLVRKFWDENEIKILCAQMVENDAWTIKVLKTSDHVATIFETKDSYKNFVFEKLKGTVDKALIEYMNFLELEYYSNFSGYIRYEFQYFDEINQKLDYVKTSNRLATDEYSNVVEAFVKCADKITHEAIYTNITVYNIPGLINNRHFTIDEEYYSKIRIESNRKHTLKTTLLEHYKSNLNSEDFTINSKDATIERGGNVVIEFISVQPSD